MRNSSQWVAATSAFLILALTLAGEGFLVTESENFRPGTHLLSSAIALEALFRPIH